MTFTYIQCIQTSTIYTYHTHITPYICMHTHTYSTPMHTHTSHRYLIHTTHSNAYTQRQMHQYTHTHAAHTSRSYIISHIHTTHSYTHTYNIHISVPYINTFTISTHTYTHHTIYHPPQFYTTHKPHIYIAHTLHHVHTPTKKYQLELISDFLGFSTKGNEFLLLISSPNNGQLFWQPERQRQLDRNFSW